MCKNCGNPYGSTKHLMYWQRFFFQRRDLDKFVRTWYHILNRKAYVKWFNSVYEKRALLISLELLKNSPDSDGFCPGEYLAELTPLEFYNEYLFERKN